jgi:hypothetical protein
MHSLYREAGRINDIANLRTLAIDFVKAFALCFRKPIYSWKRISFMSVVFTGFALGYFEGTLHFRNIRTRF